MGLTVYVHRSPLGDHTNGGLSAKHDQITVVNVPGPFEPTEDRPAFLLVDGALRDKILVPAVQADDGTWEEAPWNTKESGPRTFGGNYGATSDSRFNALIGFYGAVPIHDRFDTWDDYYALTR